MTDHPETELSNRELGEGVIEHDAAHTLDAEHFSDTTVVLGRTLPFPLYTVVFLALGVLTIIEVLVGSLDGVLRIPIMLALAFTKAFLVVYYYMHLKTDSRFFAVVLAVPVFVAIISMLFLLMTPPGNY